MKCVRPRFSDGLAVIFVPSCRTIEISKSLLEQPPPPTRIKGENKKKNKEQTQDNDGKTQTEEQVNKSKKTRTSKNISENQTTRGGTVVSWQLRCAQVPDMPKLVSKPVAAPKFCCQVGVELCQATAPYGNQIWRGY